MRLWLAPDTDTYQTMYSAVLVYCVLSYGQPQVDELAQMSLKSDHM